MLIISIVLRAMFIIFRLEIYNKTIIGFSLWFSPLKMYNKTIIGFSLWFSPLEMYNKQLLDSVL